MCAALGVFVDVGEVALVVRVHQSLLHVTRIYARIAAFAFRLAEINEVQPVSGGLRRGPCFLFGTKKLNNVLG
jgi:hypothetical protein